MTEDPTTDGVTEAPKVSRDAKAWLDMLKRAETTFEKYHKSCDNVDRWHGDMDKLGSEVRDREFQLFWANLEVLKPSIYSRPPVPIVAPKFKNKDKVARRAADLLERSMAASFEQEDIHSTMRLLRDDMAVNGRAVAWVRYETDGQGGEFIRYDHIERRDFLHEPARKWNEVQWVARREWLSLEKGVTRFGEQFRQAEFKRRDSEKADDTGEKDDTREERACVWEIWHRTRRAVLWIAPGVDTVLDVKPPFLDLEGFFPCPKPAYGTVKRGTLIPIPDLHYYKDQIEEINDLTRRIAALAQALKMRGFYPAGAGDLSATIEAALEDDDPRAIVRGVADFATMSGASMKDSLVWLPITDIAQAIQASVELRKQLIDDVYQISGLSDIMRGATDAQETLGAQQLKSKYGSVRLRDRQEELVRIARDMTRIGAEIMAENFAPETLLRMSQIQDLLPAAEALAQMAPQPAPMGMMA